MSRKLNEAVLATRLERDLTKQLGSQHAAKEQILYLYLNTTYFGDGAYGAAAAAESYFHTDVTHLTISEAAALASIIPSPSRYGPRQDLFGAETRRVQVLGEMHDQGMITQAQYDQAKATFLWPAGFGDPGRAHHGRSTRCPPTAPSQYPYFVDYVRQYLTADATATPSTPRASRSRPRSTPPCRPRPTPPRRSTWPRPRSTTTWTRPRTSRWPTRWTWPS